MAILSYKPGQTIEWLPAGLARRAGYPEEAIEFVDHKIASFRFKIDDFAAFYFKQCNKWCTENGEYPDYSKSRQKARELNVSLFDPIAKITDSDMQLRASKNPGWSSRDKWTPPPPPKQEADEEFYAAILKDKQKALIEGDYARIAFLDIALEGRRNIQEVFARSILKTMGEKKR